MTPEQAERGLCAMCLTGASLSALVGIAAQREAFQRDPKPPIYFGSDTEWKRDAFRNQADGTHQETM